MKKVLIAILVILVVILIILIGLGVYGFFLIKPYLSTSSLDIDSATGGSQITTGVDSHPYLSDDQEATLEKLGVDPAKLPTEITPEMESCFSDKLGSDRVQAIIGGESPGILDFLKAKSCIE